MNEISSSIHRINNPSWFISQFYNATSSSSFFTNELRSISDIRCINERHPTRKMSVQVGTMPKDPTLWSRYCSLRKLNMSSSHFLSVSVTKSTCTEEIVESIYQLTIPSKANRTSRLLAFLPT